MNHVYKYEVAFSFLQQDEPLASQVNDLISDRMQTFLYSERQLELVGKDGELMLKRVFGSEARIAVILYRKQWGETSWTRIEQDAIRNRAFDHGYDFCLLIPLEEPPTIPEWYPKNRIWVGLKRWGIEGAAAIIEARVQEEGGSPREETLQDRTARLQRKIVAAEKRRAFLSSEKSVKPAADEANALLSEFERLARSTSNDQIPLSVAQTQQGIRIESSGFLLHLFWHRLYENSLEGSAIFFRLKEVDRKSRFDFDREYNDICDYQFHFDVTDAGDYGWRAAHAERQFYSSKALAQYAVKIIIDKIADYRLRKLE